MGNRLYQILINMEYRDNRKICYFRRFKRFQMGWGMRLHNSSMSSFNRANSLSISFRPKMFNNRPRSCFLHKKNSIRKAKGSSSNTSTARWSRRTTATKRSRLLNPSLRQYRSRSLFFSSTLSRFSNNTKANTILKWCFMTKIKTNRFTNRRWSNSSPRLNSKWWWFKSQ